MNNNIIFKTTLIKGDKGDKGDENLSNALPTNAIIAYDGDDVPEGFIEVSAPTT